MPLQSDLHSSLSLHGILIPANRLLEAAKWTPTGDALIDGDKDDEGDSLGLEDDEGDALSGNTDEKVPGVLESQHQGSPKCYDDARSKYHYSQSILMLHAERQASGSLF